MANRKEKCGEKRIFNWKKNPLKTKFSLLDHALKLEINFVI